MADWYCSSTAYAAIPTFVPSVAYSVGQFVKPTAPANRARWAFRCTVAGTAGAEPSWPSSNNFTVTSGGVTFNNVTGQSTYGWSAAAGDMPTLMGQVGNNRFFGGDRLFVSSDHAETQTSTSYYGAGNFPTASWNLGQILSVNRAGSVPPVAADLTPGATVTVSSGNSLNLEFAFPVYHYGISYINASTGGSAIQFNNFAGKTSYFDSCQLYLSGTSGGGARIINAGITLVVLFNSTIRFGNIDQSFAVGAAASSFEIVWLGTSSAIVGSAPTVLFLEPSTNQMMVTARGVDLSAITGNLVVIASSPGGGGKYLFDSCRIASGVTRLSGSNLVNTREIMELVNCFDGTNILNESYQPPGAVTTERTIVLSGGAQDDVGLFSHKLVSGTNIDKYANPLTGFWLDCEYQTTGSSKTATVEIISSLTLNNDDISLLLEYQGTSGSSLASFANTLPTNVLTANAAVTTSTVTWNSSPATPVKQKLVLTFTPQVAGRVRGQVRLGRASTTVYVNPVITIT